MVAAKLGLKLKVRHDAGRAAEEVASYPPRLDAAMRRGTIQATNLLGITVAASVVRRTSMDASVARRITEAKVLPGAGSISRGRVSFARPRPYTIRPKKKKALFWPGARHPVAFVNHPGSRPYKLIGETADEVKGVEEAYRDEVEKVI